MPQHVLLSFCNLPTLTTSPLLCLQVPDNQDEPILAAPVFLGYPDLIVSATGITATNGRVYVLFVSRWSYTFHVAVLKESDLSPLYYQELPEIKDGHSILAYNNCLYIVSTGTDEVFAYDIKENNLENSRVIWRASHTKTDTHHINSIAESNGEILISAFGPKTGQLWSTATDGYIYNITANAPLATGIYHPHSVSVRHGQVYYSNSQRNAFCAVGQPNAIFDLSGYSRGNTWLSDERVCVATSIGRRISKSTGLVANPADPGEAAGECALYVGDVTENKIIRSMDLSSFGPEIYDVSLLSNMQMDLLTLSSISQREERKVIQVLANRLIEWHGQLQSLSAKLEDLDQKMAREKQSVQILSMQLIEKERVLSEIESSRTWKLALFFRRLRLRLLPPNNQH